MKKPIVVTILVAFALLSALFVKMPRNVADAVGIADARVYVYCRAYDGECVNVGSAVIAECTMSSLNDTLNRATHVDGVSVKYRGNMSDVETLADKLNMREYFRESVSNLTVIYGYSDSVVGGINIDGMFINVQIACDGEFVSVGSPLILGSF